MVFGRPAVRALAEPCAKGHGPPREVVPRRLLEHARRQREGSSRRLRAASAAGATTSGSAASVFASPRRRRWVGVRAEEADQGVEPDVEEEAEDGEGSFLLKFVQEVEPQVMDQFTAQASPEIVDAMKQTISNMLGNLPSKYFDVTIKTVGENLAQLMLSVMMTGYMFRNAQYRMDVTKTLALPSPSDEDEGDPTQEYAEGSQQINISGEVLRWHNEKGAESVDAMEYIEQLERELHTLREQVSMHEAAASEDRNYLLEYLQKLEPTNVREMTSGAGEEVTEAMNAFIKRLVGTDYDSEELKGIESKSTSVEMARLLYWLLIVGYSLRTIEVREELQKAGDEEEEEEEVMEAVVGGAETIEGSGSAGEEERGFMDRSHDEDEDDWQEGEGGT
ncbi:DUF760 domain-containing protein [Chloropicon roscoffensis]|uniref:DUF760 domain-containing protein n=1 Tax=Chloropicon roscoffensis TaxID=1461544 RepID=A0AAX4P4U2_9CHLO